MKKSVWVIDDDEIYQLIIKKQIGKSGVFSEQHYFKSVKEVLHTIECSQLQLPDVILLDINMPQLDGWQFIEMLKNTYKDFKNQTSIYIVSSSIAYSDKERAKEYPEVTQFLSKPVSVEKLRDVANKKSPA